MRERPYRLLRWYHAHWPSLLFALELYLYGFVTGALAALVALEHFFP
jgi:hypothetical protein